MPDRNAGIRVAAEEAGEALRKPRGPVLGYLEIQYLLYVLLSGCAVGAVLTTDEGGEAMRMAVPVMIFLALALFWGYATERGPTRPRPLVDRFCALLGAFYFFFLFFTLILFPKYAGSRALSLFIIFHILFSPLVYQRVMRALFLFNALLLLLGALLLTEAAGPFVFAFLPLFTLHLAFRHFEEKFLDISKRPPVNRKWPLAIGLASGAGLLGVYGLARLILPPMERASLEPDPILPPGEISLRELELGPFLRLALLVAALVILLYLYHRFMERLGGKKELGEEKEEILSEFTEERLHRRGTAEERAAARGARAKVVRLYARFCERLEGRGYGRSPAETPVEYAVGLKGRLPDQIEGIDSLTHLFQKARYSPFPVDEEDASLMALLTKGVLLAMRKFLSRRAVS
jgi:hypothetical protein